MPFAVYQVGCAIFGVGPTVEAAIEDAKQWVSDPETLEDALADGRRDVHGAMCVAPCTDALYQHTLAHGTPSSWEVGPGGVLSLT